MPASAHSEKVAQIPDPFVEEVFAAESASQPGKLGLLGVEAQWQSWRVPALHLVGQALLGLGATRSAAIVYKSLIEASPRNSQVTAILDQIAHVSLAEPDGWQLAILFTGHRMDAPDRERPRFAPAAEDGARRAILMALKEELESQDGPAIGLAGGASGGDLLFHEACAELGIPTLLRLTLPPKPYVAASVESAGSGWVRRFEALMERLGPGNISVLSDTAALPVWMTGSEHYDCWQRTNLWLVQECLGLAPHRTLLALWDGREGDGPGGTRHLLAAAPEYGLATVVIRMGDLVREPKHWPERKELADTKGRSTSKSGSFTPQSRSGSGEGG